MSFGLNATRRSSSLTRVAKPEGESCPEQAERSGSSFHLLYDNMRALMRREALPLLFPGKSELDIFASVMGLWLRLDEEATPAEAFSSSWYDTLYAPAIELHRSRGLPVPFPRFYMDWMKRRHGRREGVPEPGGAALTASLDAYLSRRGARRRTRSGA